MSMQRNDAFQQLLKLVGMYLGALTDDEIPNTPVALIDDFGQWLQDERDDQTRK